MDKMLVKAGAEFLGTFFFLSVILNTSGLQSAQAIGVGIGLIAAVFITAKVSGGHLNPAVSIMSWFSGNHQANEVAVYICAQVLGGIAAWWVNKQMTQ